jgi:hypothetical protein
MGDGLIWIPPPKIVWFLKNTFLVRKKYWKITKTGWCYRGMVVVVYIVLNKEFLAHIKWVTRKSHIVRCVSGGTHIMPSPQYVFSTTCLLFAYSWKWRNPCFRNTTLEVNISLLLSLYNKHHHFLECKHCSPRESISWFFIFVPLHTSLDFLVLY